MIRVLLVDDHPIVREGLETVLEDRGLEVVGSCGSVREALEAAAQTRPEVVLVDLELPDGDGVELIGRLSEALADTCFVVLTAYRRDEQIFGALKAGATGFLLKGTPSSDIVRAIEVVLDGGSYLDPSVAARVAAGLRGSTRLSPRETEVLELVSRGLSTRDMAERMHVTERTVKFHVTSILNKLGASNRAEAVALAVRRGLL